MNYPIVCKLLSVILAALAAAFLASGGLAWYFLAEDPRELQAIYGFCGSTVAAGVLAIVCYTIGRRGPPRIFSKEALATVGIGWVTASLIGALPYLMIVPGINPADAFFESTSGLTTTGSSIFAKVEDLPNSLLFWRSLSQWIGGLGVIVFFVAILSFLGAGAKILFSRESSAQAADLESERVQTGVLWLLEYYLGLTFVCFLAYWAAGMTLFDAVNHSMTTIATGGFSTHTESFAFWDSELLEWLCIVFMAIGGTSFVVQLRLVQGDFKMLRENTEIKAYYIMLVVGALVAALFNFGREEMEGASELIRHSLFHVVSIVTTTGYATRDFGEWLPVLHVVFLVLMVVGGCSASTSGGIKVVRFVVGLRAVHQQVELAFRSRVIRPLRMNKHPLGTKARDEIIIFLVVVILVTALGVLVVALFEPYMSFQGIISATFANLFNIGPGFGEVGPSTTYIDLHWYTKVFLSFLMITGRVEFFAILALLRPALWKRY